jgi:hypothetical protein
MKNKIRKKNKLSDPIREIQKKKITEFKYVYGVVR